LGGERYGESMAQYFQQVWLVLGELAPWLLLGSLIAGMLHALLPAGFIQRHLGRPGLASIVKAAALGVPLPLCSCSVIPTAIGLRREGASNGAAMGFLISTPQTGVDSITVSAAFLGWPFAFFKLASALLTGVVGGWLVDRFGDGTKPAPGAAPPPAGHLPAPPVGLAAKLRVTFSYGFGDMLYMIWRFVVFGVLVSALISTLVPPGSLGGTWLGHPVLAMLIIVVISVPLYVCAVSSVPIAAALVTAGLPAGAALVFLMAGPAVNMATIGAVWRGFGRRVTALYLLVIIGGSMLLGTLFNFVLTVQTAGAQAHHHHHDGGHGVLTLAAIATLLALFAWFAWRDASAWHARRGLLAPASSPGHEHDAGERLELTVSGMTCQGCVAHLRAELLKVPGVTTVAVDLASGRAVVTGRALPLADLRAGVTRAGFTAT